MNVDYYEPAKIRQAKLDIEEMFLKIDKDRFNKEARKAFGKKFEKNLIRVTTYFNSIKEKS